MTQDDPVPAPGQRTRDDAARTRDDAAATRVRLQALETEVDARKEELVQAIAQLDAAYKQDPSPHQDDLAVKIWEVEEAQANYGDVMKQLARAGRTGGIQVDELHVRVNKQATASLIKGRRLLSRLESAAENAILQATTNSAITSSSIKLPEISLPAYDGKEEELGRERY